MPRASWRSFLRRAGRVEGRPAAPAEAYVRRPELLRGGNHVLLLRGGGAAFPAMLEAIAAAEHSVHLETYILADDAVGERFAEALRERARAGVAVRVLYDAVGSWELPERFVQALRDDGVRTIEFSPVAPWRRRWGFNRRDHTKLLVVDGKVGFTGGLNLGLDYAPVEEGGGGWYDLHARVEGPVVRDLGRVFRHTWMRSGGDPLEREPLAAKDDGGRVRAHVVHNFGLRERFRMKQAYLHAIGAARSEIRLMNAYFLPDFGLRRAFRAAVQRGVRVSVIVPAVSDVAVVQLASQHLFPRLLRDGVRILEWPERMMHAKSATVDGLWATVGSYNISRRSFQHNLEASLVIADAPVARALEAEFDHEAERCRPVTLAECRARPLGERLLQRVAHAFRYWL